MSDDFVGKLVGTALVLSTPTYCAVREFQPETEVYDAMADLADGGLFDRSHDKYGWSFRSPGGSRQYGIHLDRAKHPDEIHVRIFNPKQEKVVTIKGVAPLELGSLLGVRVQMKEGKSVWDDSPYSGKWAQYSDLHEDSQKVVENEYDMFLDLAPANLDKEKTKRGEALLRLRRNLDRLEQERRDRFERQQKDNAEELDGKLNNW